MDLVLFEQKIFLPEVSVTGKFPQKPESTRPYALMSSRSHYVAQACISEVLISKDWV